MDGYYGNDMYGGYNNYRAPRISKSMIEQAIMQNCWQVTGVQPQRIVKLEEIDNLLRHACAMYGDIIPLGVNYFPVPDLGIQVAYYYCANCGTLYIQKDYM